MVAPHDIFIPCDQLPHVMVANQLIRLMHVTYAVGEDQIPDLVVLQDLPWQDVVNMDIACRNRFAAVETRVSLVSLEEWDVAGEVLPLVTTL